MRAAAGVALAGVGLTLCSLTFGSSPLLVPGVGFILLGALTPLWVWASARGATVRRRLPAEPVIEGQPVEAIIQVRRGPLGLPGPEVLDPLAGGPVMLGQPLSLMSGRSRAEIRVLARFGRRGLHRLQPPSLTLRDPFGLARVQRAGVGEEQELLILPRTEPVRWSLGAPGGWRRGDLAEVAGEPLAAVDVDGLRPYREGAPASRIHWPALARSGVLLERRLQPEGDQRPLIVLDPRGPGPPEQLDAAVRAAASLTLELARRGGCRVLLPGDRRAMAVDSHLSKWGTVHARLALVQGGARARPPTLAPGNRVHGLVYVAAQALERLPSTVALAGRPAVLVLPNELPCRWVAEPSFEVAGCRGYLLRSRIGAPRSGPRPVEPVA